MRQCSRSVLIFPTNTWWRCDVIIFHRRFLPLRATITKFHHEPTDLQSCICGDGEWKECACLCDAEVLAFKWAELCDAMLFGVDWMDDEVLLTFYPTDACSLLSNFQGNPMFFGSSQSAWAQYTIAEKHCKLTWMQGAFRRITQAFKEPFCKLFVTIHSISCRKDSRTDHNGITTMDSIWTKKLQFISITNSNIITMDS